MEETNSRIRKGINRKQVKKRRRESVLEKRLPQKLREFVTPNRASFHGSYLNDLAIQSHRDHMKEHAIICKFMGLWPTERALHILIRSHWKPKGEIHLHLGSKGFFTAVFTSLEDKDKVFEGGPYFYAAAGLYMWPWMMNFVPERETFTSVLV